MKTILAACLLLPMAQAAQAASTCDLWGTIPVAGGQYRVQNDVWGATTPQCVDVPDTNVAAFTVASASHNQGSVASYPSIYKGCHFGDCTVGSGLPAVYSTISSANFGWSTTRASSGTWDIAAETWMSPSSDGTNGYSGGAEIMIWLDYSGMAPAGSRVATASIAGASWEVWYANIGWNYVAYRRIGAASAINANLKDFVDDAIARGYARSSWYLHDLEAGEEIMSGGVGFRTNSFSFTPVIGGSGYPLGVSKAGTGSGTVTSSPAGINCGSTCSASFASGTAVTLTAAASPGSTFAGWSGDCTGSSTCTVTLTASRSVTATFNLVQQQGGPISINAGGSAAGSFVADVDYSGGSSYSVTSSIDTSLLGGTPPPQAVLQSERWGEFTYTIPGFTPGSAQAVTLYFAELYWTAAGQRTFNVLINGSTVLSGFDIVATAGAARKAVARTFNTTANASGQVVIQFTKGGGVDNPKVSGVAVATGIGTKYTLSVTKAGAGAGTVAGGGIDCGPTCTALLASGTAVTLTATAAPGSTFTGWSGACTGTSTTCTLTMTADRPVTATFGGGNNNNGCTAVSGGQSGNFGTTGAVCYTVSAAINGWGCSNVDGRSVTVNGTAVTCGQAPLPGGSPFTFRFTAGTYPWASFYWW